MPVTRTWSCAGEVSESRLEKGIDRRHVRSRGLLADRHRKFLDISSCYLQYFSDDVNAVYIQHRVVNFFCLLQPRHEADILMICLVS